MLLGQSNGGGDNEICVKTRPADVGTSLERMGQVERAGFFRPQAVAAKRKPLGGRLRGGLGHLAAPIHEFLSRSTIAT